MKEEKRILVIPERHIPASSKENTVYIADDGTEFYNKRECENYEERTKAENAIAHIPYKLVNDLNDDIVKAFYLTSYTDFNLVSDYIASRLAGKIYDHYKPNSPGWYLFKCNDGGDSKDWWSVTTLDDIIKTMDDFVEQFK